MAVHTRTNLKPFANWFALRKHILEIYELQIAVRYVLDMGDGLTFSKWVKLYA